MEKEKASAKRMKVGGERKHLKSILFIHNVTRGGRLVCLQILRFAGSVTVSARRGPWSVFFGSPTTVGSDMVPKTIPIQKILS